MHRILNNYSAISWFKRRIIVSYPGTKGEFRGVSVPRFLIKTHLGRKFLSGSESILLRPPVLADGLAVHGLVQRCPPLDENSSYCNFLQCSHFADTSVAAESGQELVGFVSGYIVPQRPDSLFIWQVAVAEEARGLGLASRMLSHIIDRPSCSEVRYLETSITQENQASWALFGSWANKRSAEFQSSPWMDKDRHFAGQHESEALVRIGPFNANS